MEKDLMKLAPNRGKKAAKKISLLLLAVITSVILVNCRADYNDYDSRPTFEVQIISDVDVDGDIVFRAPATYEVASAATTGTVLAGIDPASGDEFRGFFAFPLRRAQGVPLGAEIESATLEIYINAVDELTPGLGVPLIFDLVSFSPPVLIADDFDRAPLLTLYASDVFTDDVGFILSFDVTPMMVEAQQRDLTNFQIRILLDRVLASSGLIEIEDDLVATAPLLTVTYY